MGRGFWPKHQNHEKLNNWTQNAFQLTSSLWTSFDFHHRTILSKTRIKYMQRDAFPRIVMPCRIPSNFKDVRLLFYCCLWFFFRLQQTSPNLSPTRLFPKWCTQKKVRRNFNTFCFVHSFQPKVTQFCLHLWNQSCHCIIMFWILFSRGPTINRNNMNSIELGTSTFQEERHPSIEFLQI